MKRISLLILVLGLFSFMPYSVHSVMGEEVFMEEGAETTPQNDKNEITSSTGSQEETFEEGDTGKNSNYPPAVSQPAAKSSTEEEESFTEGTSAMEEPDEKPKNKTEKELENIPPASRVEEEFQEESSENYLVTDTELQDLEEKINNLRNQILDTKSKIMELGDRLSQGFISGTKLKIVIDNKLKGSFVPIKMVVKIDGYPIYKNDKEKQLVDASGLEAFSASVLPENHRIDVEMIVKGKGFGIFTYMEAVKMLVRTTYYLNAPRGKEITLHIIPYDKGSIYQLKDRPQVKFEVK